MVRGGKRKREKEKKNLPLFEGRGWDYTDDGYKKIINCKFTQKCFFEKTLFPENARARVRRDHRIRNRNTSSDDKIL